jgi:hypothetical protein
VSAQVLQRNIDPSLPTTGPSGIAFTVLAGAVQTLLKSRPSAQNICSLWIAQRRPFSM